MKRRKILGIAAAMVGGSAIIGSNAFNVGRVDRGMKVDIVKDQLAYFSLSEEIEDQGRSYEVGGQVFIKIPGIHEETDAEGVGVDSQYWFDDIVRITNQGTETIEVETEVEMNNNIDISLYDSKDSGRTLFKDEPIVLSVGEAVDAGLFIDTYGVETGKYTGDLTLIGVATGD